MKLAIIISGQPRNLKIGYNSLKQFYLHKYDCDIFIHTWFDKIFSLSVYEEMINLFKPKKILIEEQIIFDKKNIKDPQWNVSLQNLLSMYYSMYMGNKLRNMCEEYNEIKYDFIMRMRSDLQIYRPIELEKIEKDKLAVYKWTQLTPTPNFDYNTIGMSDVFALGNSEIMNKYFNLYENAMYYLYKDDSFIINGSKMRQEYILNHHIKTIHKIPIQIFWHGDQTDPSFNLIR